MKSFSYLVIATMILGAVLMSCEDNDDNPNEFTISFNCNEGSEIPLQTVKKGEMAIKPNEPTRNGYTFVAWFKEMELVNEWKFDTDKVFSDVTLYAKWIEDTSDENYILVKFDKKTFIEQKHLWQASNTQDYEYNLLANGFVYYYGKIMVENGKFKNEEILSEFSFPSVNPDYVTIDMIYETIEESFKFYNGTKKSDFYYTEISVEYDKINHIPIKINYIYYCSPNLAVDGTFDYILINCINSQKDAKPLGC